MTLILFALIVWFVVLPLLMWVVIGFGMALSEIFEAFQPNSPFVRPDEMTNPNLSPDLLNRFESKR
jgi:hypothetical protein